MFLFLGTSYSQTNSNYSSTQIIGKVNENVVLKDYNNILKFEDEKLITFLKSLGLKSISKLSKGKSNRKIQDEILLLEFKTEIDVFSMIDLINSKEVFRYLEPDFLGSIDGKCVKTPNDPNFENRQWAMVNDGTFETGSVFDGDIDMDSAWLLTTGDSTVTVSILDSGLKLDHEDLVGRIWKNQTELTGNATDDDSNGYIDDINGWDFVNSDNDPTDDNGHGTNVTGIIGANGDNNIGYAGVDWNCKLMTCKVIDLNNDGLYSNWISGIYYSVDNGANVINMSLSGNNFSQGLQDAVDYAYTNGVPIVASMGNGDTNSLKYPAALNHVIAVGATSSNNERSSPFTGGGGSNYGAHIDLVAPGNKIFGLNYQSSTNYNTYYSGTSQSAPYVTGVVALLKGVASTFTVDYIESLLIQNAVDNLGKPSEDVPGWDQYHGYGLLNAYQTLSQVINSSAEPTITYDVQTACGSFTWLDNIVYTESNNQAEIVLVNSVGCDSTIHLSLTIPVIDTSITLIDSANVFANNTNATYQWLDCSAGNLPISGANSKTFSPTYNSNYAVAITENSCTDTSSCFSLKVNLETTNIRKINAFHKVTIYPTATNGVVNISLLDLKDVHVNVLNAQGQMVYTEDNINESIKKIALDIVPGIYFIEVRNNLGNEVFRIIRK